MLKLKLMFFYHNLLNNLFSNLVLMSHVTDVYLMIFLVRGRGAENIEKKEKNREKKNIEKWNERKTKNTGKGK